MFPFCSQTNVALVAPLLRLENNHCHIEESEHVLKKAHKYSELIILYEKKGLHEKGRCEVGVGRGEGIGAYALNLVIIACTFFTAELFFCSQEVCCGLNWNDSHACKGIKLFVCLKALQVLVDQSKKANSPLKGHERTVQYLQHLGKCRHCFCGSVALSRF